MTQVAQERFASADLRTGETNALVKIVGGADVVRQVLRGELVITVAPKTQPKSENEPSRIVLAALLEEVGEPVNLAAVERFIAREKFVVNRNGELPISGLGSNFETNFLDVVEENVPAAALKQRKLRKRSVDGPILAALGDTDLSKIEKARVALAHMFDYLKTGNRKLWLVFYVADVKGVVWAVRADWDDDGWDIEASSVSNPGKWDTDFHVVSR